VKLGDELEDMRLTQGQSFRITPGTVHQMEAITDCDILEVSTPELDDVVRLQDRYGREGTSAP
jgi:quercetin dioxygenase-like cupin family protein